MDKQRDAKNVALIPDDRNPKGEIASFLLPTWGEETSFSFPRMDEKPRRPVRPSSGWSTYRSATSVSWRFALPSEEEEKNTSCAALHWFPHAIRRPHDSSSMGDSFSPRKKDRGD
ncbi:hypothetical protein BHM03_00040578, partial [Ensete ventricosum]